MHETPDKTSVDENGVVLADVAVTQDGTWQKRGHTSKNGVVFVISVRTGEVLDYTVKTLFCKACSSHEMDDKESDEYKKWFENHKDICTINHEGSSDLMETSGATEIFLRSIPTRNLRYTTFVGDGDSSCFGTVSEECLKAFGELYTVQKEESLVMYKSAWVQPYENIRRTTVA